MSLTYDDSRIEQNRFSRLMMGWIFLMGAVTLEIMGTLFLKLSNGFENWQWGLVSIVCYAGCFWMFAPALKYLPLGVSYAIWAGLGIVAAILIGWFGFGEQLQLIQLVCIALVCIGAVGLRLSTNV